MLLLLVLVFLGVFIVVALLLIASGTGASERAKQTLAVLESALGTEKQVPGEQVIDVRKQELLSAVPWLNRWLQKIEIGPRLRMLLYQADLKWTVGGLLLMSVAGLIIPGYLVYMRTEAVILALATGLLLGATPLLYVVRKRRQRFYKFEQELPETLDLIVGALRVGHSLISAVGLVAQQCPNPIGGEFRICFEEQNYGLDMRTSLMNLIARVPLQDLKIMVTAILIQRESGGNLAEVLDKTAYVIRERFRLKRQIRVHTAHGRLTGWILSLLPPVLGIALYMINPETMRILWTTPLGVKLLYTAAGMTIAGALIIRRIINMEV